MNAVKWLLNYLDGIERNEVGNNVKKLLSLHLIPLRVELYKQTWVSITDGGFGSFQDLTLA